MNWLPGQTTTMQRHSRSYARQNVDRAACRRAALPRHALASVAAAAILAIAGCSPPEAESQAQSSSGPSHLLEVPVAKVERLPLSSRLGLAGTLLPLRATTIVSEVDGVIEAFPESQRVVKYEEDGQVKQRALGLDIGHAVTKGMPVVQLKQRDFQLALKLAQANLELARQELKSIQECKRPEEIDRLKAALRQAEAAQERSKSDLERAQALIAKNALARSSYDAVVMSYQQAVAARDQADAALRLYLARPTDEELGVAQAHVDAAEAEVALRQEQLDKTTVPAPYDGVITERYVDVGDRVTAMPRVEIMQIVDPTVLFAEVAVPEQYQAAVRLGDMAAVEARGVPGTFPAEVDLVNAKIDPETRTFRVRVTIDNRRGLLRAGGFVHVELPVAASSDALVVAARAVVFTNGEPAVFVFREGRVHKTPVELGISDGDRYVVRGGLKEGDLIAAADTSLLADGLEVRAKAAMPEAGMAPSKVSGVSLSNSPSPPAPLPASGASGEPDTPGPPSANPAGNPMPAGNPTPAGNSTPAATAMTGVRP